MTAKHMRILVRDEEYGAIPDGLALITIDDNGWFGTNNGSPYLGRPALFPIAQAEAIAVAWNCATGTIPGQVVNPRFISEDARRWLGWSEADVQTRDGQTEALAQEDMGQAINVVCHTCGLRYGRRVPGLITLHEGRCDICAADGPVSEPRDYGYLKEIPKPESAA